MANNYTSACFVVPVKDSPLTLRRMKALQDWFDDPACDEPLPADLFGPKAAAYSARLEDRRREVGTLGFDWSTALGEICFNHDESIDLESAVDVAQILLDLDENEAVITAEWADTCSKARIGEFGGGAVAFTRHASEWKGTSTLAAELAAQLVLSHEPKKEAINGVSPQ